MEVPLSSAFEVVRAAPPQPPDEAALVARLRAGDEAACEALYLAHHDALWRFAYGYVHARDVADEIVQDVFLHVWRDRARWEVRGSLRAWLYGAVRNQALNHVRHERVLRRFADRMAPPEAEHAPGDAPLPVAMGERAADAQRVVEAREIDEAVERALDGLPERRRIAMTLRWKHELSAPEIARVLGTTPESVRVLLSRARQELAGLLVELRR
jgi:RNA polymerase sigma-70 factor (ECF subfamily)